MQDIQYKDLEYKELFIEKCKTLTKEQTKLFLLEVDPHNKEYKLYNIIRDAGYYGVIAAERAGVKAMYAKQEQKCDFCNQSLANHAHNARMIAMDKKYKELYLIVLYIVNRGI